MAYRALADFVVVLHLAFIVFVGIGGLLALRWRWGALVHLPAVAWGIYIELSGGICPLSPIENWLRHAAGDAGYAGGFIQHYVIPAIYPAGLTRVGQLALAALAVVSNTVVYTVVWRRHRASTAQRNRA